MGKDVPLLNFPTGVSVKAWGIEVWDYDKEKGNINLKIQDINAKGAYADKDAAAKTNSEIGFKIDTTLNTEDGRKPAIDVRYNKDDSSLITKVSIASAWLSSLDVQTPTLSITSLPDVRAVEVKNVEADVKVLFEKEAAPG